MSSPASRPYRILVLAPNWLGDVIMHTPLLTLLHENRAEVTAATGRPLEIHLGIRPVWSELFTGDPRLDGLTILERTSFQGPLGAVRLAARLRRSEFDAVLLGPPSFRAGLAAWLARIPVRVGYRGDGRSPLLTCGLANAARGARHYAAEMRALGEAWLASLGLATSAPGGCGPELPACDSPPATDPGPCDEAWAVAPGTTFGQAKTWPVERLAEFVELVLARPGARVILLGDAQARAFTGRLRDRLSAGWGEDLAGPEPVIDLTGRTDLPAVVGILKSATAFVGNDSGLMHLAAALGRPTVGIFGSSNPDWTAPLGSRTRALVADGFDCRPCYRKTCNQPVFCLDTVPADLVFAVAEDLRAIRPASPGGR